jgi:hypothetical protein
MVLIGTALAFAIGMKTPALVVLSLLFSLTLAACPEGYDESGLLLDLDDHEEPLTSEPGDTLFTIEWLEANEVYAADEIRMTIEGPDLPLQALEFEHTSAFGDETTIRPGDSLVGFEGSTAIVSDADSGRLYEIVIFLEGGSGEQNVELSRLQWVADGGLG